MHRAELKKRMTMRRCGTKDVCENDGKTVRVFPVADAEARCSDSSVFSPVHRLTLPPCLSGIRPFRFPANAARAEIARQLLSSRSSGSDCRKWSCQLSVNLLTYFEHL